MNSNAVYVDSGTRSTYFPIRLDKSPGTLLKSSTNHVIGKNVSWAHFLSIDESGSSKTAETKRGLFIAGALIIIISALLIVKLFYELNVLENQHELVKKQIRSVFVRTLPAEKKIVSEPAQMKVQLDAIQKEYTTIAAVLNNRVSPIKILQAISEKISPAQKIRFNDISMSPESVRLVGIAPSFESVDNLTSLLQQISEFNTVEVPSIDVDPQSSGVRFTLSITTVLK